MPWIFAYGSLMWDFDFECEERVRGVLEGYHRSFNKKSTRNWGTSDTPGPVLGLEPSGECQGVAFRIADDQFENVLSDIDEREGPSYLEQEKDVQLVDDRTVRAKVWVNDRDRFTYIVDQSQEDRARLAVEASGENGAAKEYVLETRRELQQLGIEDSFVEDFAQQVIEMSN